jgi:hypothetical protein
MWLGLEALSICLERLDQVGRAQRLGLTCRSVRAGPVGCPSRLLVAANERMRFGQLLCRHGAQRHDAADREIRSNEIAEPLIDRSQSQVRADIARQIRANRLPRLRRARQILQLELRLADHAAALASPRETVQLGGEEAQVAPVSGGAGDGDLLAEIGRHHDERRGIRRPKARHEAVNGAVDGLLATRGGEAADERVERPRRLRRVVRQIAIGPEIERHLVELRANHERPLVPECVTDPELVEDVGVVDRDVGDDEVGDEEEVEHVRPDRAGARDVSRRPAGDAEPAERRGDEIALDGVEVHATLLPEGADDEGVHGGKILRTGAAGRELGVDSRRGSCHHGRPA